MAEQMQLAQNRLFGEGGMDTADIKLFPGSSRDVSERDFATQVNKILSQLEAGDFEDVTDED